jgi:cardiolipin synthase
MNWLDELAKVWHWIVAALTVTLDVWASGHAILHKRDSRAATVWVGFVWFVPLVGAVAYFIFGVNRIKRRAVELRGDQERFTNKADPAGFDPAQLTAAIS